MGLPIDKSENIPQALGLVPLYPFPSLVSPSKSEDNKQSLIPSGASFLPPLYQHYFGIDLLEQKANDALESMLKEVVTEEILDIYEQLFTDGGDFLDEAIQREIQQKEAQHERVSKFLAKEILEKVLQVACRETVLDVFDDMITGHVDEMKSRIISDDLLIKLEEEFLQEIAQEVLEMCVCGEICMIMVHEVLQEESKSVVEEVLTHYGAQLAYAQYKQISKFAAEHTLDGVCELVLLPHDDSTSIPEDNVLDHIVLDILMNKSLELDQCYKPEKCIPLEWYRKKVVNNIVLEETLTELCKTLDD